MLTRKDEEIYAAVIALCEAADLLLRQADDPDALTMPGVMRDKLRYVANLVKRGVARDAREAA